MARTPSFADLSSPAIGLRRARSLAKPLGTVPVEPRRAKPMGSVPEHLRSDPITWSAT